MITNIVLFFPFLKITVEGQEKYQEFYRVDGGRNDECLDANFFILAYAHFFL